MNDECIGALNNLKNYIEGLGIISSQLAQALNKLHNVNSVENFPAALEDAQNAARAAYRTVSDEAESAINHLASVTQDYALSTFYKFTVPEKPITEEGLSKVTGALPTNSLHQYRYLNPYLYASMVHAAQMGTIGDIDVDACCCTAPEDMYVVSILKRTYMFFDQTMQDNDSAAYLMASFAVAYDYALYMEDHLHSVAANIQECLESDQIKEAAIKAITNPSMENTINEIMDRMIAGCKAMATFADHLTSLAQLHEKLFSALSDTQEAVLAAYKIYIDEACCVTF